MLKSDETYERPKMSQAKRLSLLTITSIHCRIETWLWNHWRSFAVESVVLTHRLLRVRRYLHIWQGVGGFRPIGQA